MKTLLMLSVLIILVISARTDNSVEIQNHHNSRRSYLFLQALFLRRNSVVIAQFCSDLTKDLMIF